MKKEALRQILRIRLWQTSASQVGKDRWPIIVAKIGERRASFGYRLSRGAHLAPAGGRKNRPGAFRSLRKGSTLRRRKTWSQHSFSKKPGFYPERSMKVQSFRGLLIWQWQCCLVAARSTPVAELRWHPKAAH